MLYQNTRTGAVINVKSVISGGDWQEVKPASCTGATEKATATRRKKVIKDE